MAEFTRIGDWDPSFDPAWDTDGDGIIDADAGPLPVYVDTKVFNAPWKGYVAAYWTDSWREEIRRKIDLVAAENFDGLMLDVMTCYWTWKDAYPSVDVAELRKRCAELIKWISGYAKDRYGSAFLITVNLDSNAFEYFPDLGTYVDGGYYQNAFFSWDGSAVVDGRGLSTSKREFRNPSLDFARAQGLSVLDMDHLGTGPVSPGLPVFMGWRYGLLPRFTRILTELPPAAETRYQDWVLGSAADDLISTGSGDDLVFGGAGNDRIDGGEGEDTVLFVGPRKDYEVSRVGETVVVTAKRGDEGIDVLTGIERLIFSNKTEAVR